MVCVCWYCYVGWCVVGCEVVLGGVLCELVLGVGVWVVDVWLWLCV